MEGRPSMDTPVHIEFPADVHVFTERDKLGGVPAADQNGDQTGGRGAL